VFSPTPNPNWSATLFLFFWVITGDLSDVQGPTSNYATPSTATRIISSRQPQNYIKAVIPVATVTPAQLSELFDHPSPTVSQFVDTFSGLFEPKYL
jgi:hypothetical protein